jgi:protein-disulfide isomerase
VSAEEQSSSQEIGEQNRGQRLDVDMVNPQWQTVIDHNRALARDLGISGPPGFIVGTELVPSALDVSGLKELITGAGNHARQ